MNQVKFSASLSCIELGHIEKSIHLLNNLNIDEFHYDVVDGKFNDCFIFGDICLKEFRKHSEIPITAHLACEDPLPYIKPLIKNGATGIAIHYESKVDIITTLKLLRSYNVQPILAFKDCTDVPDDFLYLAKYADKIIKLTVQPGFSGQKLNSIALKHIKKMRTILNQNHIYIPIEADGNICYKTMPKCLKAGADCFTLGSSGLFNKKNSLENNLKELKEIGEIYYAHNLQQKNNDM